MYASTLSPSELKPAPSGVRLAASSRVSMFCWLLFAILPPFNKHPQQEPGDQEQKPAGASVAIILNHTNPLACLGDKSKPDVGQDGCKDK